MNNMTATPSAALINAPQTSAANPIEKERKKLRKINILVFLANLIHTVFCLGAQFGAVYYTFPLIVFVLFFSLVFVPAAYALHMHTQKCKWLLHLMRAAAYVIIAAILLPEVILIGCRHNPKLYPIKRSLFIGGIRHSDFLDTYLPSQLPSSYSDYYFYTDTSGSLSFDHIEFAYLYLHTNEETLCKYEEMFDNEPRMTRLENAAYSTDEYIRLWETNMVDNDVLMEGQYVPQFIYDRMLTAGYNDDLSNATVYIADGKACSPINSGAIINHETGLLILWM